MSRSDHSSATRPVDDGDHVPMAGEEKVAWAYGISVLITSGVYFAVIFSRLNGTAVDEVAWEVPMLIAIGACILGVIVGTIVASIGGAVWQGVRGRFEEPDFTKDERDLAIQQLGNRRVFASMSVALLGTLVLAMIDADTFWIGNWVFLAGTVGALIEVVTKIRAYHRGL